MTPPPPLKRGLRPCFMAWVPLSNSGEIFRKRVNMTAKRWKNRIKRQLSTLDQRDDGYGPVIDTLADILEQRDNVYQQFVDDGCQAVREYINKFGAANMTKNPLLVLWDDLNKSALAYWRELGLTPSSYKKITGAAAEPPKAKGIAAALQSLDLG